MKDTHEIIIENIDKYKSLTKDNNDYILHLDSSQDMFVFNHNDLGLNSQSVIQVHSAISIEMFDENNIISKQTINKSEKFIIKKEIIYKLHPDNIDINFFWEYSIKNFPLFSVSNHPDCKNSVDVNKSNFVFHKITGAIEEVENIFSTKDSVKILEIGPGYGNFYEYLKNNFYESDKKYYAIDVNPLFHLSRLYKCNGKDIPSEVGVLFDLVYSINVFQHLSKNQRSSYYKQIHNILNEEGKFIFSMFLVHPKNVNGPYWSYFDEHGRAYTCMFGQFTEVDTIEEIDKELKEIGYKYSVTIRNNVAIFVCTKENK